MRRESYMLARIVKAEIASARVSARRSSCAVSLTGMPPGAASEPERPPDPEVREPRIP
jgi:hypothetical protein